MHEGIADIYDELLLCGGIVIGVINCESERHFVVGRFGESYSRSHLTVFSISYNDCKWDYVGGIKLPNIEKLVEEIVEHNIKHKSIMVVNYDG